MRIAVVQEYVDAARGGAETSTIELARQLANLGHDVTIVCAARPGESGDAPPQRAALRIHRLRAGGLSRLARTRAFLRAAERFCRDGRFEIVHAMLPCAACDVYQPRGGTYLQTIERSIALAGGPLARLLRRLGRRLNRRQRWLLAMERRLLTGSPPPVVAAVSEYVRTHVLSTFSRLRPEDVPVVFNGVDIEPPDETRAVAARERVRRELGLAEGVRLVLFVAHNFRLKGLAELIAAMATDAGEPTWHLLVVGRDRAAPFAALARSRGVRNRVCFAGAASEMRDFYAAADLLAHPTWYDPCSRVVLEALSCGLAVVTTRHNGAAEVVEEGRTGWVIDTPRDAGVLAAAIRRGLALPRRPADSEAVRALRERLSMARHARQMSALYEALLRARGAASRSAGPGVNAGSVRWKAAAGQA